VSQGSRLPNHYRAFGLIACSIVLTVRSTNSVLVILKVLVLGATGGTGRQIISQAIERGHSVTAFVRAPDPLKLFGDRIVVIQGDLLNRSELKRVLEGRDAVLSSFGPRIPVSKEDATLLQRFGRSSDRPD
jgi:putative NADH-flavin reductase